MARKKRDLSEDYRLYRREQDRLHAGYIKDKYPQVRELTFHFTFSDPDPWWQKVRPPWEKTVTLQPQHSALFKFECSNIECVDGGFDLSSPVRQMIESGLTEYSGNLTCQGWQDRERVGQHRCWQELSYTVTVSYKEDHSAAT